MNLDYLRDTSELLRDLPNDAMAFLESIAEEVAFTMGSTLFEEYEDADSFYLVTEGRVGLEVTPPSRDTVVVDTIGPGELLGVSWLFHPYKWSWRARALQMTVAVAFDAAAVRARCEEDSDLALFIYQSVAREAVSRLHATRVRLLDMYPGIDQ